MSKNTGTSELINYFDLGVNGDVGIAGSLDINTIANATTDTDTFLVSDTGIIKYRTGAQLLSDIGAAPATGGSYLPLAGGTLTGTLNGTSAVFSSDIQSNTRLISSNGGQAIFITANSGGLTNRIEATSGLPLHIVTTGSSLSLAAGGTTPQFTLASTGAATFTSSVTSAGNIFTTNDAVFSTAGSITRHSTVGLVLRGATAIVFDLALYSANGTALITNPTGTNNIVFNSGNVLVGTTTDNGARLQVSGAGGIRINATTGTAAPGAIALSIRDSGNTAFGFDFNLEGVATGDLYLMRTNSSVQSTVLQVSRATGAATFSSNSNTTISNTFQNTNTTNASSRNYFNIIAGTNRISLYSLHSDNNYINTAYGDLYFQMNASTSTTNPMIIKSSGNVGIGTTSPSDKLHIANNGTGAYSAALWTNSNSTANLYVGVGGSAVLNTPLQNNAYVMNAAASGLAFGTSDAVRMFITSSGNVLIGTTTDNGAKLQVNGPGRFIFRNNSNEITDLLLSTEAANATSKLSFLWYGNETAALKFNRGSDSTGSSLGLWTQQELGSTTERMRITSSGNVGIGTSSITDSRLQIKGANNTTNAYADGLKVTSNNETVFAQYSWAGINANDVMRFATAGTERMRITSTGNVGIGTASPAAALDIQFGSSSSDNQFRIRKADTLTTFLVRGDGAVFASGIYGFTTGSSANVVVFSDGSLQRSTSSIKYKKNVENYSKGLEEVMLLRPVTYEGISESDEGKTFAGLIAEEVHDLGLNEFVQYAKDGSPDALSYSNMISLLVKAIQEQQVQIDKLKNL